MTLKIKVYSWGLNFWGQLGHGHCENVNQPLKVKEFNTMYSKKEKILFDDEYIFDISCGAVHTIITSNRGRVFSTGYGNTFALGNGTPINFDTFKGKHNIISQNKISSFFKIS